MRAQSQKGAMFKLCSRQNPHHVCDNLEATQTAFPLLADFELQSVHVVVDPIEGCRDAMNYLVPVS